MTADKASAELTAEGDILVIIGTHAHYIRPEVAADLREQLSAVLLESAARYIREMYPKSAGE